jgi:hypothetical protein
VNAVDAVAPDAAITTIEWLPGSVSVGIVTAPSIAPPRSAVKVASSLGVE